MKSQKIVFVGGGNMARSLIGGLIADGYNPADLLVSDPDTANLEQFGRQFGVGTTPANTEAAGAADVLVLAVKPQVLRAVAGELAETVQARRPVVISIAAGIREADINRWLGGGAAIVRSMPNTPALVGSGASALYANKLVSAGQRDVAESILRAVGIALWIDDEALMDTVTALSGSGPAYFFLVMEAMQEAAAQLGLPEDATRLLTLQTAFGAAKMALESTDDPATLRKIVTSPGGTTEKAIQTLQDGNLKGLFLEAMKAAAGRSNELARQFGED